MGQNFSLKESDPPRSPGAHSFGLWVYPHYRVRLTGCSLGHSLTLLGELHTNAQRSRTENALIFTQGVPVSQLGPNPLKCQSYLIALWSCRRQTSLSSDSSQELTATAPRSSRRGLREWAAPWSLTYSSR